VIADAVDKEELSASAERSARPPSARPAAGSLDVAVVRWSVRTHSRGEDPEEGCKDVTTPVHIFGFVHVKT